MQSTQGPRLWLRRLWIPGAIFLVAQLLLFWWAFQNAPSELPYMVYSIGTLFAAGKEASIPLWVGSVGADPYLIAGSVWITDVGVTLVMYQFLHAGMDALETRTGFLGGILRGARRHAEKRRKFVDRYGVLGLFMYAIIPFAFNGPPVVAVLGRLAGLSAERVAPVLVAAITTTTLGWAVLATKGFRAFEFLHPMFPLFLSIGITVVAFTITIRGAWKDRKAGADQDKGTGP